MDQIFRDLARGEGIASAARIVRLRGRTDTLKTIETEDDMPIAYLPGNAVRVRVRVVGDVAPSA